MLRYGSKKQIKILVSKAEDKMHHLFIKYQLRSNFSGTCDKECDFWAKLNQSGGYWPTGNNDEIRSSRAHFHP